MLKLILLINLFFSHPPDEYFVAHIHGKIYRPGTANLLKLGEKISMNQALDFTTERDFVAVISPTKGRFIIRKNNPGKPSSAPRILIAISDNLIPATLTQTLASRGSVISAGDLKIFFKNLAQKQRDTLVNILLTDSIKLELEPAGFKEQQIKFFFLRYEYSGEVINKKLNFVPSIGNGALFLVIDKAVFAIDGRAIDPGFTTKQQLFFYNATNRSSELIGNINLNIVEKSVILQEIEILYKNLKTLYQGRENQSYLIEEAILADMESNYGFVNREQMIYLISTIKTH